jgi:DNA-binding LytR/AlgR family response regulator
VFVTAHEDAAVEAFELHALDYILKPVGRARLEEALQRVSTALGAETNGAATTRPSATEPDVFAAANVRSGSTRLVQRGSILYVQSYGDFVWIVTADGRYLLRNTLTDLQHRWEPFGFVRVHRQYLANLSQAIELRPAFGGTAELVFSGSQTIPVARRHVAELGRRLAA